MGDEYRGVLVLAEQNEGELHAISYELLNVGRRIADDLGTGLSAVFLTPDPSGVEELICRGADKVFVYQSPSFGRPDEIVYKDNLVTLVEEEKPEVFLIGGTNFGRSLAPRLQAALHTGLTADCTGFEVNEEGKLVQIRPACSSTLLAQIVSDRFPQMATVRYKEFEEAPRDPARNGEIIERQASIPDLTGVRTLEKLTSREVDITEAQVVVSGGRGLKDPQHFQLLEELAELLDGVVGSSRPLVDEGWIDRAHQVGYSGNRVKPTLYIACGISGAPNHLAGMRQAEVVVAINTDPSAPIFKVADYGIIGDLYEVVPELIERIRKDKDERSDN
ncbi:MAG: electron transfer flavoprotein subunit alpha/FixB family protein [Anaerolineae bacterium]